MFDNFWSILDVLASETVVGVLKVIWRSPKVISRSFEVIFDDFSSSVYTYMVIQILLFDQPEILQKRSSFRICIHIYIYIHIS